MKKNLKAQVTSSSTSPGSPTALLSSQTPPVWGATGTSNGFSSAACQKHISRVSDTTGVPVITRSKCKTITLDFSCQFWVTVLFQSSPRWLWCIGRDEDCGQCQCILRSCHPFLVGPGMVIQRGRSRSAESSRPP